MAEWQRVEDDDPARCQASNRTEQCHFKAQEGSNYCPRHGGNRGAAKLRETTLNSYHLSKFRIRTQRHAGSVKDLSGEIGMLKSMLEVQWNRINTPAELVLASGPISTLITKIKELTDSALKLDLQLGKNLDRVQAMQLAEEIINAITTHVTDSEVVEAIANEILEIVSRATGGGPGGV